MTNTIVALVGLGLMTLAHLVLGIFLLVVWMRKELIPADRNIVIFWTIVSFATAGACGIGAVQIARLAGLLEIIQ